MNKLIRPVTVLVLLGGIVNLSIAWSCVCFEWTEYQSTSWTAAEEHWTHMPVPEHLQGRQLATSRWEGYGVSYRDVNAPLLMNENPVKMDSFEWLHELITQINADGPVDCDIIRSTIHTMTGDLQSGSLHISAGWPLRCLQGWTSARYGVRRYQASPPILAALPTGILRVPTFDSRVNAQLLPWWPLWIGFILNSFFYAAILRLIVAAPFAVRRHRRINRGLCAECAYPIGASDVCSECGAATCRR